MSISGVHDCYGCGVCAVACVKKIIEIRLNADGFYQPYIEEQEKCTDCGICTDVCAYLHDELAVSHNVLWAGGGWSRDNNIRRKCSSGGIGFEIGRYLISIGYKVCGVRYNVRKSIAEHYISITIDDLFPSIGSKYIQSFTVNGFNAINRKEKYLVSGTPCQIDSFRRYIKKFRCEDNFILMDFYCHGVPSMLMWKQYLLKVKKEIGKISFVSWRNKSNGWSEDWNLTLKGNEPDDKVKWSDSYNLLLKGEYGVKNSRRSQGDFFYQLFLSDSCLCNACYEKCKYKYDQSSADIRIGDAWGQYLNCEDGASVIVCFSSKGKDLISRCNIECNVSPLSLIAGGQLKKNVCKPWYRDLFISHLRKDNHHTLLLFYMISYIDSLVKKQIKRFQRICRILIYKNN